MALLFASGLNGPYAADHPFLDFDPLGLGSYPFLSRGGVSSQDEYFHNYGLWDESPGQLDDSTEPLHGTRIYQWSGSSSHMTTVRPKYPIRIQDDLCDWGLKDTLIAGIAISDKNLISNTTTAGEWPILLFRDKAQGEQISVWILHDHDPATPTFNRTMLRWRLEVRRGATVLFTTPNNILPYSPGSAEFGLDDIPSTFVSGEYDEDGAVKADGWLYVEFKAVIHNVTGSWELRVDGAAVGSDAGPVNTAEQGTPGADQLEFALGGNSGGDKIGMWGDDIYLADNLGGSLDDFLGRIQVNERAVNAQGFESEWTPDSGAAQHDTYVSYINDVDDTEWLESNNPGDTELFTYANLPRGIKDTLLVLRLILRGALSVGGDRDISPVYRTGGVSYVEPTFFRVTGPTFISTPFHLETNPDTLLPWTRADVDGQELGFTLVA